MTSTERQAKLLSATVRVANNIASILDPQELLQRTVDIICDEFNFYYSGVFLLSEDKQYALLKAGRGKAGDAMLAEDHKLKVGGNSMIGASISTQEARIALDVGEEAIFFSNPHLPDTRSEMALPLTVGTRVLGAVTVQSVEESAFSDEDISTLQGMADQLAIAIDNADQHAKNQFLLKQAERRARLLDAANEVGRGVASILELNELLPKTVDIICEAYNFYYAGVFLIDENKEYAVLRAGRGEAGKAMIAANHKLKLGGKSMIGMAARERLARISLDVEGEDAFFRNPHLPETRSEMALPLCTGKSCLGAVTVQSIEGNAFSDDDIQTLQTMADHLAIAINNANLLKEVERTHAELLRTKTYEALSSATTEAIHWIGNKALPITTTAARMVEDLNKAELDVESLKEDLGMIDESAKLI
ncbi:MAG: GAF domain-containing protein, partial [Anaerolineae bacterium]|nr:GAF domain-containing protein [Anaerolineae bacterium]